MSADLSVRFTLLDQQLADADELLIGRVDDLELNVPDDGGAPTVEAVLTGAQALGERLGGPWGRWIAAVAKRLRPLGSEAGPAAIDAALIGEVEPFVQLTVSLRELPHVAGLERWLAHRVVEPIPGAGDAVE